MAARPPMVRLKTASEMAVEQMPGKLCVGMQVGMKVKVWWVS